MTFETDSKPATSSRYTSLFPTMPATIAATDIDIDIFDPSSGSNTLRALCEARTMPPSL